MWTFDKIFNSNVSEDKGKLLKVSGFTKAFVFLFNSFFLFVQIIILRSFFSYWEFSKLFSTFTLLIEIILVNILFIFVLKNYFKTTIAFVIYQIFVFVSFIPTISVFFLNFFDIVKGIFSIDLDNLYSNYNNIALTFYLFLGLIFVLILSFVTIISIVKNIILAKNIKKRGINLDEKCFTRKNSCKNVYIFLLIEAILLLCFKHFYYLDDFKEYDEIPKDFFITLNQDLDDDSEQNVYDKFMDLIKNVTSSSEVILNNLNGKYLNIAEKYPEIATESELKDFENNNGKSLDVRDYVGRGKNHKDILISCYFGNKCYGDVLLYKMIIYEIKYGKFEDYDEKNNYFTNDDIEKFEKKYIESKEEEIKNIRKGYISGYTDEEFEKIIEFKNLKNIEKIQLFSYSYLGNLDIIDDFDEIYKVKSFIKENIDVLYDFGNEVFLEKIMEIGNEGNYLKKYRFRDDVTIYSSLLSYTRNIQGRIMYYLETGEEEKAMEIIKTHYNLYHMILNGDVSLIEALVGITITLIQTNNLIFMLDSDLDISDGFKKELKEYLLTKDFSFKIDNNIKIEYIYGTKYYILDYFKDYSGMTLTDSDYITKIFDYRYYLLVKYIDNQDEIFTKMNEIYKSKMFKSNIIDKMMASIGYGTYKSYIKSGKELEERIEFLIQKLDE